MQHLLLADANTPTHANGKPLIYKEWWYMLTF
jgi:hypothetical protein